MLYCSLSQGSALLFWSKQDDYHNQPRERRHGQEIQIDEEDSRERVLVIFTSYLQNGLDSPGLEDAKTYSQPDLGVKFFPVESQTSERRQGSGSQLFHTDFCITRISRNFSTL